MIRKFCVYGLSLISLLLFTLPVNAEKRTDEESRSANVASVSVGDRILVNASASQSETSHGFDPSLGRDTYLLGPGDVLSINIKGRSLVNYPVKSAGTSKDDPSLVTISPSGFIFLPLIGNISASGKTIQELEAEVTENLSKYFKHFSITLLLSRPRSMFVEIAGQVAQPGFRSLPAAMTACQGVLQSDVFANGSVRRVEFIRGNKKRILDLYRVLVLGDIDSDIYLQPGDRMFVPAFNKYVELEGEVVRPGRFEMVTFNGETEGFRVRDLLQLAMGTVPSAALGKSFIERIGSDGRKVSVNLDISEHSSNSGMDTLMLPGDKLVIPSIALFQPMIRMIGEFKGDGVYQRILPAENSSKLETLNKSGIYYLKQGQTAGDVIVATGGVTPQADLKLARIERNSPTGTRIVPIDLERLLVKGDKSADTALENGDSIILPAVVDKVHIFGEVKSPGSFSFSPNRRIIDYLGDAGGPTSLSKLESVRIIRGTSKSPEITTANVNRAMKRGSLENNPVLNAGDIIYVPSKALSGWRDALQLIFTGLSLSSVLHL